MLRHQHRNFIIAVRHPFTVILKHALPLNGNNPQDAFLYNALIHFGNTQFAVGENNGNFTEANFISIWNA